MNIDISEYNVTHGPDELKAAQKLFTSFFGSEIFLYNKFIIQNLLT